MRVAPFPEQDMCHVEMDCFVFARVSRATQKLGTIRARSSESLPLLLGQPRARRHVTSRVERKNERERERKRKKKKKRSALSSALTAYRSGERNRNEATLDKARETVLCNF